MTPRDLDAAAHFAALVAQADAFFERVRAKLGDQMQCGAGCSSCCTGDLSVTAIEAVEILALLAGRDTPVSINMGDGCAALDEGGRCQIYDARPLRCRTHGVPIAAVEPERTHLPVISSCELNFAASGALDEVPADCRLDQQTLDTKLWAIDAAWSDERGEPRNRRYSIRELLE